jgi:hypothetical protein
MITPNDFHADDVYLKWNKLIKMCNTSIKIFTPYLDSSIIKLLANSQNKADISIITRIDGDTIFERAYQLNTIRSLLAKGYLVRNCELLHAKVLIVDNEFVSVGSQNFTYQGRKNKETSYISNKSFIDSKFISTLSKWEEQAKIIDIELIDKLLDYFKDHELEVQNLREIISAGVDNIVNEYEEKKISNKINFSSFQYGIYRFAQGEVVLTRTIPPPDYSYYSYFASDSNDLCQWVVKKEKGNEEIIKLTGYEYYSSFNLQTHELKFVRIHSSRITFTLNSFTVSQWKGLKLLNLKFSIEFIYLIENTQIANIELKLSNYKIGSIILKIYFNGKEFKLVKWDSESDRCKEFIFKNLINKPLKFKKFLVNQMKPYPFTTSKDAPKDIEKFLGDYKYLLRITEVSGCPILIFDKV